MKNPRPRDVWFAALATVAALAPFSGKAFHIDEPLFIWMAQQISLHPQDPYGFSVNWYSFVQPIFLVMQNPPLSSYYTALIGRLLGWSELAMHLGFLLPAVAAIIGTFFLARRLSAPPLLAALFTLFTPVFFVSATTVMCDVWLLALWVWSITCWLGALEHDRWSLYLLSAVLAAAAALTKYFGLSLVPLLFIFALVHDRRFTFRLLFLLIPLLAIAWYDAMTKAKYGQALFSNAVLYPWTLDSRPGKHFFKPLLTGLSFSGGCMVSCLFFASVFRRRIVLFVGAAIFVAFLPLFYFVFASAFSSHWSIVAVTIEGALFATIGIGILALAVADLVERKSADSVLLFFWVTGTFVFAALLNWSVTSRTLLPIAPAVAILLLRRLGISHSEQGGSVVPWWPLLPAALLSLFITDADYKLANTARSASRRFQDQFRGMPGTVWFQGHWGFQYYMERWKAQPVDVENIKLVPGDVLVVALNNTNLYQFKGLTFDRPEHVNYVQPLLATMNEDAGAGFYSSVYGPLPWVFADVSRQRYDLLYVR
jgi:4-amino-4-deoxy-L-arabinose transferase-like glycosyltransferase